MFETKCTIESFLVIRKAFVVLITVSIALVIIYRLQWAEKSHRQQESYNALLVCSISTKDLFYVNLVFFLYAFSMESNIPAEQQPILPT